MITIIGLLAVAFLPSILNAPAKARDVRRIADLQKIQKIIISADLEGAFPTSDVGDFVTGVGGCIQPGVVNTGYSAFDQFATAAFGGSSPVDPSEDNEWIFFGHNECDGRYGFAYKPGPEYKAGLYAKMETFEAANVNCEDFNEWNEVTGLTTLNPPVEEDPTNWCFAILVN